MLLFWNWWPVDMPFLCLAHVPMCWGAKSAACFVTMQIEERKRSQAQLLAKLDRLTGQAQASGVCFVSYFYRRDAGFSPCN